MNNKKLNMKVAMWRMGDCIFQIIVTVIVFYSELHRYKIWPHHHQISSNQYSASSPKTDQTFTHFFPYKRFDLRTKLS